MDTSKVNRVEVIDHTPPDPDEGEFERGRVYVKWEDKLKVTYDLQDAGRTLKIFIGNSK
jgi:hypothetical protein